MAMNKIWFGNERLFQWAPCPLAGLTVKNSVYTEGFVKQNGGLVRTRSPRYSKVYNMTFSGLTHEVDGINVYNKYASGVYAVDPTGSGTSYNRRLGKVYFADPYAFETNLFSAEWAAPGLGALGWTPVSSSVSSFLYTNPPYNQPHVQGLIIVDSASGATPTSDASMPYIIIPIPPTHTLHLGARGAVSSGAPVIRVEKYSSSAVPGTPTATSDLTLISPASSTKLNATVSGASYAYAKIFFTRTSASFAQINVLSMLAQLWPTGVTPLLTGDWYPGEGNKGLRFADDGTVEDYRYMYPPRKGISTTLEEAD